MRIGIPVHTYEGGVAGPAMPLGPMEPPPSPNREQFPYKGTRHFQGMALYIENPKGSTRSGVDREGNKWSVRMKHDYGEIAGTRGSDGDAIDVFVGPNALAPNAYIVHTRDRDGVYDEDKVMLGFDTEEAAVRAWASNYDRPQWRPGVTCLSVAELAERVYLHEADMGVAMTKSGPSGGGWQPIPGGRHGGLRRHVGGTKRWEYWYPEMQHPDQHPKWERDPGRTHLELKPGDLVEAGGRRGLYRFTPEHEHVEGAPSEGAVWVTHTGTGEHEEVRRDTLTPVRGAQKVKPGGGLKIPPPPPPPPPKGSVRIGDWEGPVGEPRRPSGPITGEEEASDKAKRAKLVPDSEAKPGTVLHELEHGVFQLQRISEAGTRKATVGVFVPPSRHAALLAEFRPELERAVQKMARRFHIRTRTRGGEKSEQHQQLMAGATLGLVMALNNYSGGKPFLPIARRYIQLYALREARAEMGAVTIPDRTMKALGTFIAAWHQSARGKEPTAEQVAKKWVLKKKQVYAGTLGNYRNAEGEVIDQGEEEVPDGPWRVRTPAGHEAGELRHGKIGLFDSFRKLIDGERVKDSDWMGSHESELVMPGTAGMPLGTAFHLRMEVEQALTKLPDRLATVLRMRFGLHDESGEEASAEQIAGVLGIEGAEATKRREVAKLVERAVTAFKRIADREGLEVARFAGPWARGTKGVERLEFPSGPLFPSHRELQEKFGNDRAVHLYHAAVRAGQANVVEPVLLKMKQGTATVEEIDQVERIFHEQRDRDRITMWKRFYRPTVVDPDSVRSIGPEEPHDTAKTDYLVTVLKRGHDRE